jgi:uncharacterized membrane protein YqhA
MGVVKGEERGGVRRGRPLERFFERLLWGSRLLVLVAVVAGLVLAVGAAYVATVDAVYLLGLLFEYGDPDLDYAARGELRDDIVTVIAKVLDEYLISAILIVFSLGLYELFVGKIDAAEGSQTASRLLYVRSIDDLKDKVVRLVLLILAIEFFQRALQMRYDSSLDLMYLAGGILLLSAAFYLIGLRGGPEKAPDESHPSR